MYKAKPIPKEQLYQLRLVEMSRPIRRLVRAAREAGIDPQQVWEEVGEILTQTAERPATRQEQSRSYVGVYLHGGGKYIQPRDRLDEVLDGEMDADVLEERGAITLEFSSMDITDDEFDALPEFAGH